jgi:predicted dehydrogenase
MDPAARLVNIGIIGSGEITRMVAPMLTSRNGVRVTAVASRNRTAAAALAGEVAGAEVCEDWRELLRRSDVEAVYIATPPATHVALTDDALAAGKHVVCEKPFVLSMAEWGGIDRTLRRHPDLKVASCSSRFLACPPVRAARQIVRNGGIGSVQRLRLVNAMPPPTPLTSLPVWKRHRDTAGGGVLMDWGVYDVDWMRFVLGAAFDPVEIFGVISRWGHEDAGLETGFSAEIVCRSGVTIAWERWSEFGPGFQRAEIRGSAGGLDIPFMPSAVPLPASLVRHGPAQGAPPGGEVVSPPMCGWDGILAYPVLDLAEAVVRCQPVASPPPTQRLIHSVIDSLYESARTGKSVAILA